MTSTYAQPIVTVDIVLLTLKKGELHAALVRRNAEPHQGVLTLPGGWIHTNEDNNAECAAIRILKEKACLVSPYLEQLQTFASRTRDKRGWSVSIAYYALVPADSVSLSPAITWVPVSTIKTLPFDHFDILQAALSRVQSKTLYSSLPVYLMPNVFTLRELQEVYEALLGASLDKRSFRRRIEELDIIEPVVGQLTAGQAHRPAQTYRRKVAKANGLVLASKNLEAS